MSAKKPSKQPPAAQGGGDSAATQMREPIGAGKIKDTIRDFLKTVWTGQGPEKKARHVAKQYTEC